MSIYGNVPIDFNQRFLRAYACRIDPLGVDPLQDAIALKLLSIPVYTLHKVTQDERAAPDLISLREYENPIYWWHIIAYNEIISFREVVEGLVLKIPSLSAIMGITTDVATRNNSEPVVVYI